MLWNKANKGSPHKYTKFSPLAICIFPPFCACSSLVFVCCDARWSAEVLVFHSEIKSFYVALVQTPFKF